MTTDQLLFLPLRPEDEPAGRAESAAPHLLVQVFQFFARGFGRRPALLAALVLISGCWLTWQLWAAVRHHESVGDRVVMLTVMTTTWLLLLWRLRSTDKYLRQLVQRFYRKLSANPEGRRRLRLIVEELSLGEKSPHRMLSLVRWMPDVFLTLVMVLTMLGNVLWLAGETGLMSNGGLPPRILPWAALALGVFFLMYNDMAIGERLIIFVSHIPDVEMPPSAVQIVNHRKAFYETLSRRQQEVATLRYEQQKTLREIAGELFISEATVHTHINNINHSLKKFVEGRPAALGLTLWQIFSQK